MAKRTEKNFEEEVCTVTAWRDKKTGVVIMEDWRDSKGQPHRFDGPAYFDRDPETGILTTEIWSQHGKNHRDDEPALINRDAKTGRVTFSRWFKDGEKIAKPTRSGGVAKRPGDRPAP